MLYSPVNLDAHSRICLSWPFILLEEKTTYYLRELMFSNVSELSFFLVTYCSSYSETWNLHIWYSYIFFGARFFDAGLVSLLGNWYKKWFWLQALVYRICRLPFRYHRHVCHRVLICTNFKGISSTPCNRCPIWACSQISHMVGTPHNGNFYIA